jgi:hypothetical protein
VLLELVPSFALFRWGWRQRQHTCRQSASGCYLCVSARLLGAWQMCCLCSMSTATRQSESNAFKHRCAKYLLGSHSSCRIGTTGKASVSIPMPLHLACARVFFPTALGCV